MFLPGSYRLFIRQLSTCKFSKVEVICCPDIPAPIWHINIEIKIRKYVSARILSCFHKAVVGLQIFKVEVVCFPDVPGSYHSHRSRN